MRVRWVVLTVLTATAAVVVPPATAPAQAPAGNLWASVAINATYTPVAGNFDCDEGSDEPAGSHNREEPALLMYAPGSGADYLWTDLSISGGRLSVSSVRLGAINRTYVPVVADFDGDRCDDILWYAPGTAPDALWWGGPTGFTPGVSFSVNGTYRPVTVGNAIFWYAPHGTDSWWIPTGNRSNPFTSRAAPQVVRSDYQPVAMTNGWNGLAVIVWYAPGTATDAAWSINAWDSAFTVEQTDAVTIDGSYRTARWGTQAILHAPGAAADSFLGVNNQNKPALYPLTMAGSYVVGGKGRVLLWHAPGSARDEIWLQPSQA